MPHRPDLADYHVHTARCGHAVGRIEEYVERAIAAGLSEVGFSDHLFLYWLPAERRDPTLGMAEWELDAYIQDVERMRRTYPEITVRLAIEADYVPGHERQLETILRRYDWDYVLGSVHFLGDWGFDDARYVDGYRRWDIDDLYHHYFDTVCAGVETGLFDVVAHLDLVKKFGFRPPGPLDALYRQVAARLARTGVAVEVNTSGLRKPCAELYPAPDLLRACFEAGLPATLSSDAHDPADVARDYEAGLALLRDTGYSQLVRFSRRRRTLVALPTAARATT